MIERVKTKQQHIFKACLFEMILVFMNLTSEELFSRVGILILETKRKHEQIALTIASRFLKELEAEN